MTWTNDELDAIGIAEELNLASVRRDGTLRRPVTMWVVRDGDDVYVRSVNGRRSPWFRGARTRHEAHVRQAAWKGTSSSSRATSGPKPSTPRTGRSTAAATRRSCPQIVAPEARAATLELIPR